MSHIARNYQNLIGQIPGLSEKQLREHFKLYAGYVESLNDIERQLRTADRAGAHYAYGPISELHRRRAVAFNGAYLHQYYFENLTGKETQPSDELKMTIEKDFGSLDDWWMDARAALMSTNGWVLLTRSRIHDTLRNVLVEEHHRGLLVEQDLLLALDGWEHAYLIDYGVDKAKYLQILGNAINWNVVTSRFEAAEMRAGIAA